MAQTTRPAVFPSRAGKLIPPGRPEHSTVACQIYASRKKLCRNGSRLLPQRHLMADVHEGIRANKNISRNLGVREGHLASTVISRWTDLTKHVKIFEYAQSRNRTLNAELLCHTSCAHCLPRPVDGTNSRGGYNTSCNINPVMLRYTFCSLPCQRWQHLQGLSQQVFQRK